MIIGIDEVGRGAWAGPMVVCGMGFDHSWDWKVIETNSKRYWVLENSPQIVVADSKILTKQQREATAGWLEIHTQFVMRISDVQEINVQGIRSAWNRAVNEILLIFKADLFEKFVIDGNWLPASVLDPRVVCETKAESKYIEVAAASILAKVYRDTLMSDLAMLLPGYGWERNVGYGTKDHQEGIIRLGRTGHHRDLWLRKLTQKNTMFFTT